LRIISVSRFDGSSIVEVSSVVIEALPGLPA